MQFVNLFVEKYDLTKCFPEVSPEHALVTNIFLAINRRLTFTVKSFTRTLRPSSFVYPVYSEREHVYVRTADHIADLLDFDKVVSFLIQVVSIF